MTKINFFCKFFLAFALFLVVSFQALQAKASDACKSDVKQKFAERFYNIYQEHLNYQASEASEIERSEDSVAAPLSSPPMPNATWSIGGTSALGYGDTTTSPLMEAIYCSENGQKIKDSRIKLYGWFNVGANASTSKSSFNIASNSGGNYPASYYNYSNQITLNQLVLNLERLPNTLQRNKIDYGFRISGIYGTDYKYTLSNKFLSNQYLKDHRKYGLYPAILYGEIFVPQIAKGLNIRVGRYLSIPDIESQLAPNNYVYSHSLLYTFDPFTREGIVATAKLNKNWTAQFELSNSADVTVFDKKNRKLSFGTCLNWTSDQGNDNFYPCISGINSGNYGYDNVQMLVATWYHKFNNKLHTASEGYYMWQRNVPNVNHPNAPKIIAGTSGAQCSSNQPSCTASAFAGLNYLVYQLGDKDYLTLRNEFFKDVAGQRTGYKTLYTEHLIGWGHSIGDVITLRPELRFDHSYDTKAYDGGRKSSQWVVAADAVVKF